MPARTDVTSVETRRSAIAWLLHVVEVVGNRLPDPITIFAMLSAACLLASWVAAKLGAAVIHPITGETIAAVNLLDSAGVRRVLTGAVGNFTGFAPMGTVLTAMIGIGVAERAGLFSVVLRLLVTTAPRRAITPMVILAGILSHTAADAGYLVLIPLAPIAYAVLSRHPLAGIAAAFAGIGAGFAANVMLSAIDPLLAGLTQDAARLFDPAYEVRATANYYFLAISVPTLVLVGTVVSNRIVEPRFGPWNGQVDASESRPIEELERRGLWAALVAAMVTVGLIALLVAPQGSPLRDTSGEFGPFYESLVALLMIVFVVPGLAFGVVVGRIRNDKDVARMMTETLATMATYIVMAFFAGQFVAYFRWSQLGTIVAIEGASLLKAMHLTGAPLMIAVIVVTAVINLLMASASAKWAILASVFVPMLMVLGFSPETTQGLYRVGDSTTNVITPLNYYYPIVLLAAQRWVPRVGMGTLIAAMLPYTVAFFITWTVMIVAWVLLGWPMGPGSPLTYQSPLQ